MRYIFLALLFLSCEKPILSPEIKVDTITVWKWETTENWGNCNADSIYITTNKICTTFIESAK